jgi:cytochrome c6
MQNQTRSTTAMKRFLLITALLLIAAPAAGLADGRDDYRAKCASCHGANSLWIMQSARKLGVSPQKLSLMASKLGKEEMITVIEQGRGKMPAFEKELSRERIADIVDYLQDQQQKRHAVPPPTPKEQGAQ